MYLNYVYQYKQMCIYICIYIYMCVCVCVSVCLCVCVFVLVSACVLVCGIPDSQECSNRIGSVVAGMAEVSAGGACVDV